jgi:hypothetical protein
LRVSPYWPFLLVLVLPALPLVVELGDVELGEAGVVDEDELDDGDVLIVVELSDGGVLDEPVLIEPLALVEPDGVMLLVELGEVELLDDELLGVLGVTSLVDEVLEEGAVVVELLLRSQPVTAAVATASTATRGMSLFMTSPFRNGCGVGRIPHGAGWALRSTPMTTHNACQPRSLGNGGVPAECGRETFRRRCNPFLRRVSRLSPNSYPCG